ncbi:MAG: hypothetical protein J2P24_12825 [Streptosporangiales bacterium]|nr:hypothetical protein [Streptosporangiales bacterium]
MQDITLPRMLHATVGYFAPKLKVLRSGRLSDAQAAALASRWVALDRVRLALGTFAFLAGLAALSQTTADRGP